METVVDIEEAPDGLVASRLEHFALKRFELRKVLGAQTCDRQTRRQRLEHLANLVGLKKLLAGEYGDVGSAARLDRHQPLSAQTPERPADRPTADAKALGERDLGQFRPGTEMTAEYVLAEQVVDALAECAVFQPRVGSASNQMVRGHVHTIRCGQRASASVSTVPGSPRPVAPCSALRDRRHQRSTAPAAEAQGFAGSRTTTRSLVPAI